MKTAVLLLSIAASWLLVQACATGGPVALNLGTFGDDDAAGPRGRDDSSPGTEDEASSGSGSTSGSDPASSGTTGNGLDNAGASGAPTAPRSGSSGATGAGSGAGSGMAGCTAAICPSGCCDPINGCQTGTLDNACGTGGSLCTDCTTTNKTCTASMCVATGNGGPPSGGGPPGISSGGSCNLAKCPINILCWGVPCCTSSGGCGCHQLGLLPCQ